MLYRFGNGKITQKEKKSTTAISTSLYSQKSVIAITERRPKHVLFDKG